MQFSLLIVYLCQIGASAYSQIQKLYNLPVEQTEEEMEKEKRLVRSLYQLIFV